MKKKKLDLRDLGKKSAKPEESGISRFHSWKPYFPAIFSFLLLTIGLVLDASENPFFRPEWIRVVWYSIAYIPVGWPVVREGWKSILKGTFFTEFLLMSIATLGAFAIGEYPEGVAVMLFYAVGELFQQAAVNKARGNIRSLLDVRPREALVFRNGEYTLVSPEKVAVGERIQVRAGEKIPLDGILLSEKASINAAAITGESKPDTIYKGDTVFSGSINLGDVIEIQSSKEFKDSSISRILSLVQEATARKSKTELFIRKFAKVYTPIVVYLAIGLTLLPYFFVGDYEFSDWLYRALIFLVISCPCALVISIPLGYFGGLGAASRNGILFKGATFLDLITKIDTVVMDKTGTLTLGVFKVKELRGNGMDTATLLSYLHAMESQSTHPVARAIMEYGEDNTDWEAESVKEIPGKGLEGNVNNQTVLVGNKALMDAKGITLPPDVDGETETLALVAVGGVFAGYAILSDEIKPGAKDAIRKIRKEGVRNIGMLSGDKDTITQKIARELGMDWAQGGLLPDEKLREVEKLKAKGSLIAFMGDGINDAPVLAASDIGIAMGAMGSDVAIETADMVIQTDKPEKLARAIQIGRSTRRVVWQNISLAFGVKALVLILGAVGIAGMWEAVFADVGVAFLAILNAVRLQRMQWK